MSNIYTTSKTVRLYDQRTPEALLHPETELKAVVASSGGVVNIAGNSIWVSASDIHDAEFINGGTTTHLAAANEVGELAFNSLCVESATGGTVTVAGTTIGGGNGAIVTSYTVTPIIQDYTSATDTAIPTEKAVAGALLLKQPTLIAGQAIVMSGVDGTGRQEIGVNLVQGVSSGSAVPQDTVPTEYAVRNAIDERVLEASAAIVASGFATSAWCLNTFWQKGEVPPSSGGTGGDVPAATYDTAGKVQPISNGGLTVGAGGSLTLTQAAVYANYTAAAAGYLGGVKVVGSVSSATAAQQTIPYVPHAHAVYAYVSNSLIDYAPAKRAATTGQTGVVQVGSGLYMSSTSALCLSAAQINSLGGVSLKSSVVSPGGTGNILPTESAIVKYIGDTLGGYQTKITNTTGIYVSGATCTLSAATANSIGGVTLKTSLADNSLGTGNQVPTGSAVSGYVSAKLTGYQPKLTTMSGITVNGSSILLNSANIAATYANAYTMVTGNTLGGVAVMASIASATSATWKSAPVVPTVQAVYEHVSAAVQYNGPFKVSISADQGYDIAPGAIYLSDDTIISSSASYTGITAGGSGGDIIWLHVIYSSAETDYEFTTYRDVDAPGSRWIPIAFVYGNTIVQIQRSNVVIDLDLDYTKEFAISMVEGVAHIAAGSVYANGSTVAVYTVPAMSLSSLTLSNVILWLNITSGSTYSANYSTNWAYGSDTTSIPIAYFSNDGELTQYQHGPVVMAGPAGSVAGTGGGDATAYSGPFAVAYANSSAIVSGGYINTKDSVISAGSQVVTAIASTANALVYLECASGYKCAKVAEPLSSGVYAIVVAGGTYNRATPTASAECWTSGATSRYTSFGLLPQQNAVVYSDASLASSAGVVSSGIYSMHVRISSGAAFTSTYYKPLGLVAYNSAEPSTAITAPFYVWEPAVTDTTIPQELGTQVAFDPEGYWISAWTDASISAKSTAITGTSAVFATGNNIPIAEVSSGTVRQVQYGDVTFRATPDVYHGDFNVQKMPEVDALTHAASVTYTSGGIVCERYRLVTERYVYVDKGGAGTEHWGLAGLIYGVPVGTAGQWSISDPLVMSGTSNNEPIVNASSTAALAGKGAWIHDIAIEYPTFSGTVSSGGASITFKDTNCLYLPKDVAMAQVWLNIYKGTNSNFPGVAWHVQLDSQCLENLGAAQDRYSVLLANIRDGKVEQVQSGAIDIRGRWS